MQHRRFARTKAPRRKSEWEYASSYGLISANTLTGYWLRVPAGAYDTIEQGPIPSDFTLTRTIMRQFTSMAVGAGSSVIPGCVGIIAWDGIDETTPQDLPDPATQGEWDWILRRPIIGANVAGSTLYVYDFGSDDPLWCESRSQRKMSTGTGILWVISTPPNNDVRYSHDVRMHFKIP